MKPEKIISDTIEKWSEYLEMYPGKEWELICSLLAIELSNKQFEIEYYKKLVNNR